MLLLRSIIFQVTFYLHNIVWFIAFLWTMLAPRAVLRPIARAWAASAVALHRLTTGSTVEIRHAERLVPGGAIVAAKHQSAWETIALFALLPDASFVLKRELLNLPLFGWYLRKMAMIPIDRARGTEALRLMLDTAARQMREGRQLVIFPEGTRQAPGAAPHYHSGVGRLYEALGVPCVPVALNTGLAWPRGSFLRPRARIIVEYLPPIPPGLPRAEFMTRLQTEIEAATARLLAEAAQRPE